MDLYCPHWAKEAYPYNIVVLPLTMPSRKYELSEEKVSLYELRTSMTIKNFTHADLGTYNCVSTNTMGRANSTVYMFGK